MKKFWSRYWLSFLLNIFLLVGMILSAIFGDEYLQPDAYFKLTFYSLVVMFFVPIYSLIYGSMSYVVSKKTWLQQIMLAITLLLEYLIFKLIRPNSVDTIIVLLIYIVFNVFLSVIASGITALTYEFINKNKN
ncbi:MAG: hypothetical protein E7545_04160 [Ruminococcaceae bacterium]|nr:hypothetical protein [Oscillospiraceae bacterium]